ncbi:MULTISPECIES: TrbI/VirB10 family protein [unclassified Neorhizobium]|uniref:TrbI/VirB10 family protein n=1 Tax=unclassified Neorhizobium TaxID=2629175 RepID=UPI001FF1B578|nr:MULTISPECIES: TrbI/VirB10 family protein [unclassified Neorhizobium]MCJ9670399.1 conjugal transfer protein [Neorhizobium sp. SHOUNA12B]MCJ9746288.1 conjugal transfer protein [Neorhizobium sp. SHOUNA12A]
MQDDDAGGFEHHEEPKASPQPLSDREVLLQARRARQKGSAGKGLSNRRVLTAALMAGCAGGLFILVGPAKAWRMFGTADGDAQKTSQISLKVDNENGQHSPLDFTVPAAKPDNTLNEQIKALQDQVASLKNGKTGMSNAEMQKMLEAYNNTMAQKLEAERKAMAENNARLQEEAERARVATRRAEEAARRQADAQRNSEQLDKKQRESNSVLIDNSQSQAEAANANPFAEETDKNRRFLKANASSVVQTSISQRLPDPSRMVVQGTIISAVLETAIDTALPGSLRAQVMEPVYSFDGSRVMMPQGTILIGEFNNDVEFAQRRVMIAWNRAITPEGKSIALGSIGTDTLGRSGTEGNVDNRYGTKFGAAALISAITAIPTIIASQTDSRGRGSQGATVNVNTGGQVANDIGGNVGDQTNAALGKYLSLGPIIRIPQGEEIRIFVNRDLVFR